jgi:hypothetical protein
VPVERLAEGVEDPAEEPAPPGDSRRTQKRKPRGHRRRSRSEGAGS